LKKFQIRVECVKKNKKGTFNNSQFLLIILQYKLILYDE
jgi:hypothetical protein